VPSGNRWIHEIKFDGYRVQVHILQHKIGIVMVLPKQLAD
jgi:bifunctional non-homologous end joining protein LigD